MYKSGYHWPDSVFDKDIEFALNMVKYARAMVPYCKKTDLIIQAGGCIGLYPLEQARVFKHVLTFEAEPENFACLVKNTKDRHNVFARHAALTSVVGPVHLKRKKYATHQVTNDGEVQVRGVT